MKADFDITYYKLGKATLLLEWPKEISLDILKEIISVEHFLENHPLHGVKEWNSAYQSMAVHFDPDETTFDVLQSQLNELPLQNTVLLNRKRWDLPVCYGDKHGKDLETLAKAKDLAPKQLVKLHSKATYTVYFLGFLPGFMYLGGLDERLHQPRKENPDRIIPAGSVAIGGTQTGIYPTESPGGWHVIGNCPVPLFDVKKDPPCFVGPGDEICFDPVDQKQFSEIQKAAQAGSYQLKSELIDG